MGFCLHFQSEAELVKVSSWEGEIQNFHFIKSSVIYPPISSGTGQHFVDTEDMEGVNPDPDVETLLAAVLHKVLVAADAASLQGLGGQLLQLVRDQVDRQGELINTGLK